MSFFEVGDSSSVGTQKLKGVKPLSVFPISNAVVGVYTW